MQVSLGWDEFPRASATRLWLISHMSAEHHLLRMKSATWAKR
jgi:hypothetical protein